MRDARLVRGAHLNAATSEVKHRARFDGPRLAVLRGRFKIGRSGGSRALDETKEQPASGFHGFLTVAVIALAICAALVGGAVYLLQGESKLPFNYQGFDNK